MILWITFKICLEKAYQSQSFTARILNLLDETKLSLWYKNLN
ncbi:hypothetical protein AO382_1190 [Moraxella catarrhalis]|uniref:Uncharacterized protein n=1 Tax=Moraxella catarrhalis TaxID=480 RepID=A0A7Z1A3T7_MORCA|nr:hypothetical protein AO382_1190 [Moraxella catarrhalis]